MNSKQKLDSPIPPQLSDEEILEAINTEDRDFNCGAWTEVDNYERAIARKAEANRDLYWQAHEAKAVEAERERIRMLFWFDEDSKTAGTLVTGSVIYSELYKSEHGQALQQDSKEERPFKCEGNET